MRFLIVDENELEARQIGEVLVTCGYEEAEFCTNAGDVEARLLLHQRQPVDVVFVNAALANSSGETLLLRLAELAPHAATVVVVSDSTVDVETVVRCMHAGALDCLVKPVDAQRLQATLRRVDAVRAHRQQPPPPEPGTPPKAEAFSHLLTQDARVLESLAHAADVATSTRPLLIEGETGTGKELVARGVHDLGGRNGSFVPVSLSGLRAEEAAEALFGMRDSQASASASAEQLALGGACRAAADGTLFVEELVEVDVALQRSLLELALACERMEEPPLRLVVASTHNLAAAAEAARLRPDLYYRLQAYRVGLPPLRERPVDIPLLLGHFLREAAQEFDKPRPTPPEELVVMLAAYHFPGNVRELRAMVYDAVAKHRSRKLSMATFKEHIDRNHAIDPSASAVPGRLAFPPRLPTLKETTNQLIDEAMSRASGKQSIAARMLGISQSALSRRLKNRASGN